MEKLHYIHPITVYKYNGCYYAQRPFFINKLKEYFSVSFYARVKKAEKVDFQKFLPIDKRVEVIDFFESLKIAHFLSNFFLYRKKIKALSSQDLYFIHYPSKRLFDFFLALLLRKRNLSIWVKAHPADVFKGSCIKGFDFSVDAFAGILLLPFDFFAYTLAPKVLFSGKTIFYTGGITGRKLPRTNQQEIISCPLLNRDESIIKKEVNHNVVFVGGERYRKGLHILLKALGKRRLGEKVTLNVIGLRGVHKRNNKRFAKKIKVNFHGEIYERNAFYKKLSCNDILVMPSLGEKQGKVQLEAMSVGVVPVCANSKGTSKTIKDGYNGLLFKQGDYKDLRWKLENLYADRALYEKLKKNGMKYSKELCLKKQCEEMADTIKNYYSPKQEKP